MTGLLASVMTVEEAEAALAGGADIIDLKDPRRGALGALPAPVIRAAMTRIAGRRPVSATVGDLPMEPEIVGAAAERIAALGVDFVKVGIFPGGDRGGCLDRLSALTTCGTRLVAVLFADQDPDFALLPRLRDSGFAGAMLDTADKSAGGLRRYLDESALRAFVDQSRTCSLLTGLAGSLGRDDIPALLPLQPDYLGFRGALTLAGRSSGLDAAALAAVRAAIPEETYTARRATAAAGAQRAAQSLASDVPSISSAKST